MGLAIDRERFGPGDYLRFEQRLEECLPALDRLLERPGLGTGPTTVGAELELFLIDDRARALPRNQEVRAEAADPRVVLEVDRFNLELNLTPAPLAGRPFAAFADELDQTLGIVRSAAAWHGGRVVLVGILPTLRAEELQPAAISDAVGYRALNNGIRRLRQEPFRIRIDGDDPLDLAVDDIAIEGANTSFQVHLRVDPDRFASTFNAVQLATSPALAVAGNSPTFLGHRLWEEIRVARFKQAIDDRNAAGKASRRVSRVAFGTDWARNGAVELLEQERAAAPAGPARGQPAAPAGPADHGQVPSLEELRLHQSTVRRWNRAIYDPAGGGNLRIEMRALPAGPTVTDMLANAAFLVGLALARPTTTSTGPLSWGCGPSWPGPLGPAGRVETVPAAELVPRLLPAARRGLTEAGVAADEADRLLAVIEARAGARRTGAAWQRETLAALEPPLGRDRALVVMLERYLQHQRTGEPVHAWTV